MTKSLLAAAALAALPLFATGLSTGALADTAQLHYRDLDLSTEAGKVELAARIDAAARKACPPESITGSRIPSRSAQERCIADARRLIAAQLASRTGNKGSIRADAADSSAARQ